MLLPILLWPFVFFTTIFFFDHPSDLSETYFYFIIVNIYPLYLILIFYLNSKLYRWSNKLAYILPFTFVVIMLSSCVYFGYEVFTTQINAYKTHEINLKEKLELRRKGILGGGFVKKNNYIYFEDSIVVGANPNTFEIIDFEWSKDDKMYFYRGNPIPEIDYLTFEFLDYGYSKDKNHVYYYDEIIKEADVRTFHHIQGTNDGKDFQNCFRDGEKVDCDILLILE